MNSSDATNNMGNCIVTGCTDVANLAGKGAVNVAKLPALVVGGLLKGVGRGVDYGVGAVTNIAVLATGLVGGLLGGAVGLVGTLYKNDTSYILGAPKLGFKLGAGVGQLVGIPIKAITSTITWVPRQLGRVCIEWSLNNDIKWEKFYYATLGEEKLNKEDWKGDKILAFQDPLVRLDIGEELDKARDKEILNKFKVMRIDDHLRNNGIAVQGGGLSGTYLPDVGGTITMHKDLGGGKSHILAIEQTGEDEFKITINGKQTNKLNGGEQLYLNSIINILNPPPPQEN